ncbi:hypothetical protein NQ318_010538 [Aromia moschata]|uniref:Lipase domain-containing protein n=1 Tax=Aromia moschata TaxID=1265417 RepID=A0AAV8YH77_9CUCU|nr:hypothetical protein NQ318_010538 [Aromia moschata]
MMNTRNFHKRSQCEQEFWGRFVLKVQGNGVNYLQLFQQNLPVIPEIVFLYPNVEHHLLPDNFHYCRKHENYTIVCTRGLLGFKTGTSDIQMMNNIALGLDPTIVFYMGQNASRDLDPTDAHFVDILHTGAGILGQWGPNGHADFYINGGSSQPGCARDTIFKTLACDHTKVTPYFIESIVTRKGFWAYPCPTLLSFIIGWCSPTESEYVLMGEHITHQARGTYYVRTNPNPPFAQGPPEHLKRKALQILKRRLTQ